MIEGHDSSFERVRVLHQLGSLLQACLDLPATIKFRGHCPHLCILGAHSLCRELLGLKMVSMHSATDSEQQL